LPLIPCIRSWSVSVMSLITLETPFDGMDLTDVVSSSWHKCLNSEEVDERVPSLNIFP
jgi:hypothetical protein